MPNFSRTICSLLATFLFMPAVIAAQEPTYVTAPPAEQYTVSPGGVDMRTGKYAYRKMDLSAGPDGAGIKFERMEDPAIPGHMAPFANMSHNWDVMLTVRRRNLVTHAIVDAGHSDYQVYVTLGGRTQTFRSLAATWPFEQTSQTGFATLAHTGTRDSGNEIYTYTDSGGSTIVFRTLSTSGNSDCSSVVRCAYPAHMTIADGTKFTFTYETRTSAGSKARIKTVTSNRGFRLLFEYGASDWNLITKACLYNLAVSVAPASACDGNAVSQTSYTYTTFSSKPKLATVVDAANKGWSFTYFTDGSTPAGKHKMGFLRPGDQSPWLTNLIGYEQNTFMVPEEVVWKQSYIDGSSWTYNYDRTPTIIHLPPDQPQHVIAGGYYEDQNARRTTVEFGFPPTPYSVTNTVGGLSNYYLLPNGTAVQIENGGLYPVQGLVSFDTMFNNLAETETPTWQTECNECASTQGWAYNLSYQVTPGPILVTDPLGRSTAFDYCDTSFSPPEFDQYKCLVSQIRSTTDAEGRKTEFTYTGRRLTKVRKLTKPGTTLAPLVEEVFYDAVDCYATPKVCDKPTGAKDANGNVTSYTYDPAHGGMLSEVRPAVDGVSPAKKFSYVQRTASISTGSGYTPESSSVWLLSEERSCNSSALNLTTGACAAGASDLVVVSYDYGPSSGPNNLLLRGKVVAADGVSLRTCYGYDKVGNLISETLPRADRTSCN